MKKVLNWMTFVLMVFTCVGFAACGSDDDDDKGSTGGGSSSSTIADALIGTWRDTDGAWWEAFTFRADNTGKFVYHHRDGREDTINFNYRISGYSSSKKSGTVIMTWLNSGKIVYMTAGQSESRGFSVVGNYLYWDSSWGDVPYVKQ